MSRIKMIILMFLLLMGMSFDPNSGNPDKITIATASSLTLPMKEIKKRFEERYNIRVNLVSASSGILTAQIIHGAPFDVFISADLRYPQKLYDMGISSSPPQTLIEGSLVFWSKNPMSGKSPQDILKEDDVQAVAIANPELAPFGRAAVSWLWKKNIYREIRPKLVYGESIGNVNQFIFSGNTDAAFTSVSALHSSQLGKRGYWKTLPPSKTQGIPHGVVLLRHTNFDESHLHRSRLFMKYLFSDEAQSVFRQFGFIRSHKTS